MARPAPAGRFRLRRRAVVASFAYDGRFTDQRSGQMRIDITGMALCATLLLAGCNAPATADGDDATVAATAPAAEPAAAPEAVDAAAAGSDQAVPAAAGLPPG